MNSPLFSSLSSNSRKQLQGNWSLALPRSRQLPWLRYRLPAATPSQRVLTSYILLLNWIAEITYQLSVIGKNFAWMIFLPITNGGGNGHAARICGFVVSCQFFSRAVGY
jgi:hypothetical protein